MKNLNNINEANKKRMAQIFHNNFLKKLNLTIDNRLYKLESLKEEIKYLLPDKEKFKEIKDIVDKEAESHIANNIDYKLARYIQIKWLLAKGDKIEYILKQDYYDTSIIEYLCGK